MIQKATISNFAQESDGQASGGGNGLPSSGLPQGYMTTEEAAEYLRRSVSWMLRQKDVPYYRGKPNLYRKADLDQWMDENRRYVPMVM